MKQFLMILTLLCTAGMASGQNKAASSVVIPDSLQVLDKDPNFTTYTAAAFNQCWAAYPGAQLVDVRSAEEYAKGHIASAQNIDVKKDSFLALADSLLDKSKPVAVVVSVAGSQRSNCWQRVLWCTTCKMDMTAGSAIGTNNKS